MLRDKRSKDGMLDPFFAPDSDEEVKVSLKVKEADIGTKKLFLTGWQFPCKALASKSFLGS